MVGFPLVRFVVGYSSTTLRPEPLTKDFRFVVSSQIRFCGCPRGPGGGHWQRKRGAVESRQQLVALRESWPLAFPAAPHDVRPLTFGTGRKSPPGLAIVAVAALK